MATVINNPSSDTSGSGAGLIVGIVVAIVVVALFFLYGLPALRNNGNNSGTTVNVPDKIQVDVNKSSN